MAQETEIPLVGLFGFAILFRTISFVTFLILEDDLYRFLWDGRMLIEHARPYQVIPIDFFDSSNIQPVSQSDNTDSPAD